MPFNSLSHLLNSLDQHKNLKAQREFNALLAAWFDLVGPAVAAHTRPTAIQRQVLQVATSSPAWAQNLAFERYRLLEKLNSQLGLHLTDIRFSTAQWYNRTGDRPSDDTTQLWHNHPSRINLPQGTTPPSENRPNAVEAFQGWAKAMQARSRHLPQCPRCQCPTPEGELKRWTMCALCATKEWQ